MFWVNVEADSDLSLPFLFDLISFPILHCGCGDCDDEVTPVRDLLVIFGLLEQEGVFCADAGPSHR